MTEPEMPTEEAQLDSVATSPQAAPEDALAPKHPELDPTQPAVFTDEIDAAAGPVESINAGQLHAQPAARPAHGQAKKAHDDIRIDYDFIDSEDMDVELDEWYSHAEDFVLLRSCRSVVRADTAFQALLPWHEADTNLIQQFIAAQLTLASLDHVGTTEKRHAICTIFCIAQGLTIRWVSKDVQNVWIRRNAQHLFSAGAYPVLVELLGKQFDVWFSLCDEPHTPDMETLFCQVITDIRQIMTSLYIMLEATQHGDGSQEQVSSCRPCLVTLLLSILARPRGTPENWEVQLPVRQIALLLRKAMLVTLGEQLELLKCKRRQRRRYELPEEADNAGVVTATTDEYAQFRAEIASKYPGFKPSQLIPQQTAPFELRQDKTHELPTYSDGQWSSTPAPSPPPSPRSRKGIFQTDQALPFPLPWSEDLSNKVPKSVEEATLMFHSRQRRDVAHIQTNQSLELLMRHDRGWDAPQASEASISPEVEEDKLLARVDRLYDECLPDLSSAISKLVDTLFNAATQLGTHSNLEALNTNEVRHTNGAGEPYRANGLGHQGGSDVDPGPEDVASIQNWLFGDQNATWQDDAHTRHQPEEHAAFLALHQFQILLKGISGFLLLLLKWFKVSHVLKFEFVSACLMDSDWVAVFQQAMLSLDPLLALNSTSASASESSFYTALRRLPAEDLPDSPAEQSLPGHDASGLPIWQSDKRALNVAKLRRAKEVEALTQAQRASPFKTLSTNSTPKLQQDPKSSHSNGPSNRKTKKAADAVSSRILFGAISLCKILHKCTKKKTGRAHLLLQHRIWLHLRRPLRVPHSQLQEIVLKLYKTQVPLCSRKWRSTNMKVITQIYMACKPELRDDWISGGEHGGVMSGFAAANAMGALANGQDLDLSEAKLAEDRLQRLIWFYNRGRAHNTKADEPSLLGNAATAYEEESDEEDFFERELNKRFAAMSTAQV
ncbi:hypothetical protein BCR37DRAFT_377201 [Protomyces lactucae-debilis]|uniref:Far11/STRP C-terminal domain-containing protein n=1 Tax=Protomyces lactucae-debilis TaxID=2754530 RepID=A0A1Y2FNI7_PROLT|nr:uncharacterized protein BCR37DRAFT_377201 [Protomyces lactucae-debilis]ORY85523.1 hypothetical protein BCR37DRAFT_377201 [Protomyces lactucae-debilis]